MVLAVMRVLALTVVQLEALAVTAVRVAMVLPPMRPLQVQ